MAARPRRVVTLELKPAIGEGPSPHLSIKLKFDLHFVETWWPNHMGPPGLTWGSTSPHRKPVEKSFLCFEKQLR